MSTEGRCWICEGQKDRTMPWSEESERTVIGAVLIEPSAFAEVAPAVRTEDFSHPAHRAIWSAIVALDGAHAPIDDITIAAELGQQGTRDQLTSVGGSSSYLAECAARCITPSTALFHAQVIARFAQRRRWINAAWEVLRRGYSECSFDEFRAVSEQALLAVANERAPEGPKHVKPVMRAVTKTAEERYERRDESGVTGIATGYTLLDAMTGGLQPGDLVIVAGRPSMGKSALAMAIVQHAASLGIAGLVFSHEMSGQALGERMVSSEGRINGMAMRSGKLQPRDWLRFAQATSRIVEWPLWIDDEAALPITELRSRARRWRLHEAKDAQRAVVVVDYLQLVRAPQQSRNSNREQEVSEISRGLKALAKDLSVPVIALSQLNRSCESRTDKRPMLSDLRESGSIEQDADVIALMYRDEVYNAETPDRGVAEIIIAKQRMGPTGVVRLAWLPEYSRFENLGRAT